MRVETGSGTVETGTGTRRRGRPPKAAAGGTKSALLDAALTLFAANGYQGTSVRAIARAVGLSESVLYAHFDSKRAIFEAVLGQLGPLTAVAVLDSVDLELARDDPPGFITTLVSRILDEWSTPAARQLISLMTKDGLIHDPELMARILVAVRSLAKQFDRWIAAGQIAADLGSSQDLAYSLIAPVALARVLWLHNGAKTSDIATARERATRHAELFAKAVFLERLGRARPGRSVLLPPGHLRRVCLSAHRRCGGDGAQQGARGNRGGGPRVLLR